MQGPQNIRNFAQTAGMGAALPVDPNASLPVSLQIQARMPISYPAIAGVEYMDSQAVATNESFTFNVPSNTRRLLGVAIYSADSSEATWIEGVRVFMQLNQETVLNFIPVEMLWPTRNPSYGLGYFPISRKVQQGDSINFQMTTGSPVNVICVVVYQKESTELV